MLFAIVSLLIALVLADNCQLEGNTFRSGDSSITFGRSSANGVRWVIHNRGTSVLLFSWSPVAGALNTFSSTEIFSLSGKMSCGSSSPPGVYSAAFSSDCSSVRFSTVDDFLCEDRVSFLTSSAFTLVVPSNCGDEGTFLGGTELGGAALAEVVIGAGGFAIGTSRNQHFLHRFNFLGTDAQITTIYPATCGNIVGTYSFDWETVSCGLQICGLSDACSIRGTSFHGMTFNSYRGNTCPDWDNPSIVPPSSVCNKDGSQWNFHPYDCIDQPVEGGCAFCAGRVHGRDINICVPRGDRKCNDIFNQIGTHTYCNLAFECGSGSAFSFSVLLIVSCLVAFFF